jgi:hypothetical protein
MVGFRDDNIIDLPKLELCGRSSCRNLTEAITLEVQHTIVLLQAHHNGAIEDGLDQGRAGDVP